IRATAAFSANAPALSTWFRASRQGAWGSLLSAAAVAEVPHLVAQLARLGLVTRLAPATGAVLPGPGAFDEPFEGIGVPAHDRQRMAQVHGVVGREAKFAAWPELGREQRQ